MRHFMLFSVILSCLFMGSCTHCPLQEPYTPRIRNLDIQNEADRMRLIAIDHAFKTGDWTVLRTLETYHVTFSEDDDYYILEFHLNKELEPDPGYDSDYDIKISKDLSEHLIVLYR